MKKEILGNGIYVIGEMARGHKDIRPAEISNFKILHCPNLHKI